MTIDEPDRKLLAQLQQDSSLSLEEIGGRVNLSRNACWRRIKALEEAGVIKRRVALLDAEKLGFSLTVFILIRTQDHSESWLDAFRAATRSLPQIQGVYRMTGDLDYLIRAQVSDMADYDLLYQSLIRRVTLSDVSASFVMEEIKDTHAIPL
ncbi:MAG: Lrp/AsnC family transcriptional regulator [Roseobacter sp.]